MILGFGIKNLPLFGGSKRQQMLYLMIKVLFPESVVIMNYRHPDMKYSGSKKPLELDIFVPHLALAFEYQGEQHYMPKELFGSAKDRLERDSQKRAKCLQNGITLVEVPYWWSGMQFAVKSSVSALRPEIFPDCEDKELMAKTVQTIGTIY
jgi:hypothetical protein